jgi:urea transporter
MFQLTHDMPRPIGRLNRCLQSPAQQFFVSNPAAIHGHFFKIPICVSKWGLLFISLLLGSLIKLLLAFAITVILESVPFPSNSRSSSIHYSGL